MNPIPPNPDASGTNGIPEDVEIDNQLRDLFTDSSGIVRGVCSIRNVPGRDTHYQLADGTVHTFHVYADESASRRTNLYVPAGFSKIKWVGGSTVVATNPTTKEVINFYHVRKTETLPPPNDLGSRCIGQIGGGGAERPGDIHTHGTLFRSRASRDHVENWRMEPTRVVIANVPGFPRDINSDVSEHVRDIRSLV
jgi:hypothetical protein